MTSYSINSPEGSQKWAELITKELRKHKFVWTEAQDNVFMLPFKGNTVSLELGLIFGDELISQIGFVIFVVKYPLTIREEMLARVVSTLNDWNTQLALGSYELRTFEREVRFKYGRRLFPGDSPLAVISDMNFVLDSAESGAGNLLQLVSGGPYGWPSGSGPS